MAVDLLGALGASEEASIDRVTLYIPTRDVDGQPVKFEEWTTRAMRLLSEIGGGATRMPPSRGAWLRPDGELIEEEITLVYSFVDGDKFIASIGEIRKFLHSMGRELKQGEVVIEVSDRLYKIRVYD